jgi:uncharacterized protein
LLQNESANCLTLGVAYKYVAQPPARWYGTAVFDGNQFVASIMLSEYFDYKVALLSKTHDEDALWRLYTHARKAGVTITNFNCEWNTAEILTRILREEGRTVEENRENGVYRCRAVKMPPTRSAVLRPATMEDLKLVGDWTDAFQAESLPKDRRPLRVLTEERIRGGLMILEDEGQPVAMAHSSRHLANSCSISMVYTAPQFRRRGYGALVTALVTKKVLGEGKRETNLLTDLNNPTSNKIYRDIGYEMIGRAKFKNLL